MSDNLDQAIEDLFDMTVYIYRATYKASHGSVRCQKVIQELKDAEKTYGYNGGL